MMDEMEGVKEMGWDKIPYYVWVFIMKWRIVFILLLEK